MRREGASGFLWHWIESQVDNAMLFLGRGVVGEDGRELRDRRPQGYRASRPRHQREPKPKGHSGRNKGAMRLCGDGSPPPENGGRQGGTLLWSA